MADARFLIDVDARGARKAAADLGKVDKKLSGLAKGAAIAGAAILAAGGVVAAMRELVELADKASRIDKMRQGFDSMAKSANLSAQSLTKLQTATRGTMGEMDLLQQANNAMLLGVVENTEQFEELFSVARRLGSALGKDTAFAVESLVTGLGRQSKLMLDNLGIMVDVEKANKQYAESLGKSSSELSDAERKQAFINATMTEARRLTDGLGEDTLTLSDRTQRAKVELERAGEATGRLFTPALNAAAEVTADAAGAVADLLDKLSKVNSGQADFINTTGDAVDVLTRYTERNKEQNEMLLEQPAILDALIKSRKEMIRQSEGELSVNLAVLNAYTTLSEAAESSSLQIITDQLREQAEAARPAMDALVDYSDTLQEFTYEIVPEAIAKSDEWLESQLDAVAAIEGRRNANKRALKIMAIDDAAYLAQATGNAKAAAALAAGSAVYRAWDAAQNTLAQASKVFLPPIPQIMAGLTLGAGLANAAQIASNSRFAKGGSFETSGPQLIMVGDNAGGRERVDITPISSPNINGPSGGNVINLHFGAVTNDEYVRDYIVPQVQKAASRA